ncbi:MAG TPA: hypothetical protein VKP61_03500 [Candidatus Acidoferrum sp.]|nr:hypothetical protein [Candidatus Acidoferrum sp.]
MIRASIPLSKSATKAANDDFYANHPDMVVNGKRLPIQACDPKHAKLRNEWMKSYQGHGGKVEKASANQCAAQVRAANSQANSVTNRPLTGSTQICPGPPPAPAKDIASTPLPGKPPRPCKVKSSSITCEHGRKPSSGLLCVVPDSYGSLGDSINCTAELEGGCGEHIAWDISGMWTSHETGSHTKFLAKTFKPAFFGGWLGLHHVSPQTYRVNLAACQGSAPLVEIRAYPPDKLSGKIDFEEVRKKIKKVLEHLPIEKEEKIKLERGWFVGSIEYSQQWKEYKKSARAFCETTVAGSFDPFLGFKLGPVPIYPLNVVPAPLQHWLKAGVYFTIEGGLSFTVEVAFNYEPEQNKSKYEKTEVSLFGMIKGKLSINLYLVSEDVLSAEVAGGTGLRTGAKFIAKQDPEIELFFQWTGIVATVTFKAAGGIFEYNRAYPLVKESERFTHVIELTKQEAAGSGE